MSRPTQSAESSPAHTDTAGKDPSDLLPCDVVMAGGVASGLVYPGAISTLAKHYRFQSIGGTSVGALTAAATAAAEFGRITRSCPRAFDSLADVPRELAETVSDGNSRLWHLFTPDDGKQGSGDTRALMRLARIALEVAAYNRMKKDQRSCVGLRKRLSSLISGVRFWSSAALRVIWTSLWALMALGGCLLLTVHSVAKFQAAGYPGHSLILLAIGLIATATVASLALVCEAVWRWLPAWKRNDFGICSGMARNDDLGLDSLTPWLHEKIQQYAGRKASKPVTFGDLWRARDPDDNTPPQGHRAISLDMITSDISRNRLLHLPFIESVSPLYIEERVLRRYMPPDVVNWIVLHRGEPDSRLTFDTPTIKLPPPEKLPILFAARLSLSFPVLLSAIKLREAHFLPDKTGSGAETVALRDVYLSDGGITSNFPVQFFDAPFPRWPTFCFNLVDYVKSFGAPPVPQSGEAPSERLQFKANDIDRTRASPKRGTSPDEADWDKIIMGKPSGAAPIVHRALGTQTSLVEFAMALVDTARYSYDYSLISAPGVRERVVHVALDKEEGGLNLNMPKEAILALSKRGSRAASLLRAHYDHREKKHPRTGKELAEADRHFTRHRWTRYRNIAAAMEQLQLRYEPALTASEAYARARGEPSLRKLLEEEIAKADSIFDYKPTPVMARHMLREMGRLKRVSRGLRSLQRRNPEMASDLPRCPDGKPARNGAPRPAMRYVLRPLTTNDPRAEFPSET